MDLLPFPISESAGQSKVHGDGPDSHHISVTSTPASVEHVIDWGDPRESRNPRNWKLGKKIFHTVVPCLVSFEVTLSTSITVPATAILAIRFSVTRTQSLLTLTLYTIGLAFGPLFLAPLSEVLGRRLLYISTLTCLLLFTAIGSVCPTFGGLLICRFLAGFSGSAGMAMGGGSAADLWELQTAGGKVGPFFILAPFLGPIFGPLAGSYILESHDYDWRWTQWIVLIIGAPIWVAALLMKETSKKWILAHSSNPLNRVAVAPVTVRQTVDKIRSGMLRSIKLLTTDTIVISLSIYTAYAYALIFGYFAGVPYVFRSYYGFTPTQSSLTFLSIMIGYILAVVLFMIFDCTLYARQVRAVGGQLPRPEYRLYSALAGSVFLPVGLFWFAWTARENGNWLLLAASGIPFGLGAFSLFLSTINYLVDVYQSEYAASAIAANGLLRFTLGAVFPLFAVQMFEALTVRWAVTLYACLSLLLLPIPWLLMRYGAYLRGRKGLFR